MFQSRPFPIIVINRFFQVSFVVPHSIKKVAFVVSPRRSNCSFSFAFNPTCFPAITVAPSCVWASNFDPRMNSVKT
jgi:hypothetical protein